jgi:predicted Holliday junction resolvase-like endonuclease
MDTLVAELVSFLQPLKSGSLIALVLIGLALIIFALVYQRIKTKRVQTASTVQENFENIAADLRERALEVKKQDEGLRKRELEVKERKQQQQVLRRSQRALKGSVSHTMLQPDFKKMTSVVPDSSKADLQRKPG